MDFEFLSTEHLLEVVDHNSTTFRSEHTYVLKALGPSRFFVRHYAWTGKGFEKEPVPELLTSVDKWGFPEQRIHGPLLCEDTSRTLIVDLGRILEEGEETTVRFRHKMKDLNKTFRPLLSSKPSTKVSQQIVLKVSLPQWSELKVWYASFDGDSKIEIDVSELEPTQSEAGRQAYEKTIVNPNEKNYGHKIEWSHS